MVNSDVVRRGYDEVAAEFESWRTFDDREQRVFERFLDSLPPDPRILDAGCGGGFPILQEIVERFPNQSPIGTDLSASQLAMAAERVSRAELVQSDFTRLPLTDSSVDGVVAFHSLIHVPADLHAQAIAEFARVVRPNGRVLISEGAERWAGSNPDWLDTGAEMQWHIAGEDTTRKQIQNAGLTIENEWPVTDVLVDGESWVFFEAVPDD